jgi:hypothetical protein
VVVVCTYDEGAEVECGQDETETSESVGRQTVVQWLNTIGRCHDAEGKEEGVEEIVEVPPGIGIDRYTLQ